MARAKILFDKQNLSKIISRLNIYERGVFLTLSSRLFHEGHYAYLYDTVKQVRLTRAMVIQELADMNISYESAELILSRLIEHGAFSAEGIHILCPELSRQEKVSHARKRNTGFKKKAQKEPQVIQQSLTELNANQDDIKAHMAIESMDKKEPTEKEKKFTQEASEVLEYLNMTAKRPAGFQNIPSNTKFIIARLKEGHTVEQLKMVVDYKTEEWLDTNFDYCLRPGTLFIPKNFPGYLNTAMKRYEAKKNDKPHALAMITFSR